MGVGTTMIWRWNQCKLCRKRGLKTRNIGYLTICAYHYWLSEKQTNRYGGKISLKQFCEEEIGKDNPIDGPPEEMVFEFI